MTGSSNINGTGNSLNNVITGNSGNNVLDGGAGADALIGGSGNDTYVVDNAGDVVTENSGEGIDIVQASVTYTLGANVENLILTGSSNINGTGNSLNNVIIGNSGNNMLDGRAGNDTMEGGLGDDTYLYGSGSGNDTIVSYEGTGGNGNDTVQVGAGLTSSSLKFQQSGQNLIVQIQASGETLTFTNWFNGANYQVDRFLFADNSTLTATQVTSMATGGGTNTITGTTGNDTLTGGANADLIYGLDGNDTLNGGAGADTLIGGAGNDTYIIDNSGDIITENSGEGTDLVQSNITYTLGTNVESLTLTGTTAINGTGNELNNTLSGNSGNNVLTGGAGNDVLYGGAGSDTYVVGGSSVGYDMINDNDTSGGVDTLRFQDLVIASIHFTRNNNNLICTNSQTGEKTTVLNWALGASYQVEQFQFTDGTLTAAQVNQKIA